MSLRQEFTARVVTPFLTALLLVVVALAWAREPETVSATTAGGSVVQGGGCPLTTAQQKNSVKAWNKMMPVFRHPRCLNCHGGIPDPLPGKGGPTTKHAGVVDMDSTDTDKTCQDCHMDGWHTGPGWTNKNDEQLCSFVKMFHNSAQFVEHIILDGGHGFIEAAFQGLRGLNEGGQTVFEEDLKRPLKAEPPPGTHAQLIQQAKDWVAAQGGRFVGNNDCGCVIPETGEIYLLVIQTNDARGFPGILVTDSVSMKIRIEDTTVTVFAVTNSAPQATPPKLSFTVPQVTVVWIPDPLGNINIVSATGNLALDFPVDGARHLKVDFTHAGTRYPEFESIMLRNARQKDGGQPAVGVPGSAQFELVAGKKVYDIGPPPTGMNFWLSGRLTLLTSPVPAGKPKP